MKKMRKDCLYNLVLHKDKYQWAYWVILHGSWFATLKKSTGVICHIRYVSWFVAVASSLMYFWLQPNLTFVIGLLCALGLVVWVWHSSRGGAITWCNIRKKVCHSLIPGCACCSQPTINGGPAMPPCRLEPIEYGLKPLRTLRNKPFLP